MARSTNPLDRPGLDVVARDTGDRYAPSPTNKAMQLAEGLRSISPEVNATLNDLVATNKAQQEAQAKKDALTTNGAKLADAVRDGRIKKTQNPFYMQAYATEGAAVRSKAAFSQLLMDSASWPEKNDPKAFAAKWAEETAKIGQGYTSTDEVQGFTPVASQYTQQVLQSNVSENAARVEKERMANLGALGADSIQTALRAKGGNLTAPEVQSALAPAYEQWVQTGGSPAEFNKLAVQMVTSAAYATNHADLIDTLKGIPAFSSEAPKDGVHHGSLFDIPGVAQQASQDQYYVGKQASSQIDSRVATLEAQEKEAGRGALDYLDQKFGTASLTSPLSGQQIVEELTARGGMTPGQIAETVKQYQQRLTPYASLDNARYSINGNSPEGGKLAFTLAHEAATNGYSSALEGRIAAAADQGIISWDDANRLVKESVSTSRSNRAEGRSATNFSQGQQDRFQDAGGQVRNQQGVIVAAGNLAGAVATQAQHLTGKVLDAKARSTIDRQVKDAARAHLAANPGDYVGALTASKATAAQALAGFKPAPKKKVSRNRG